MLALQAHFAFRLLDDLNRLRSVHEKLMAPLVLLGLADLIVLTHRDHRLALEALTHAGGFSLGIPLPSSHG